MTQVEKLNQANKKLVKNQQQLQDINIKYLQELNKLKIILKGKE